MLIPAFMGFGETGALAVPTYIAGPGASSVASLVLGGAPIEVGDIVVFGGGNSSATTRAPVAPLTDTLGESKAGTSMFMGVGIGVLSSATQTLEFDGVMQRLRCGIWRGSTRINDYAITFGTGTSATMDALDVDDPNCACWDFVYIETASITIGDPSNLVNISGNTSGASWRTSRTADGAGVGAGATFTPGACSLSSSTNWMRLSAIISPVP